MIDQIRFWEARLAADRSARPGEHAFVALDDVPVGSGDGSLRRLGEAVLSRLTCTSLLAARPSLPFAEFLLQRAPPGEDRIVPRDTETRTFLHDIPILRAGDLGDDPAGALAAALSERKGAVAEGIGIVAVGALAVEQSYIHWSSVFHGTFVKYLQDLLAEGLRLPGEKEAFLRFRRDWLLPLTASGLPFRPGPLRGREEILAEMSAVGRYTVGRGLVDSYFGNLSCLAGDILYISQTAASLDALEGCIDAVPRNRSSTEGITATSELLAHRRIYETSGARTILHGHPRFAVAMSLFCEETGCPVTDCWKECDRVRFLGPVPIVAGEVGAGGLAKRVPAVLADGDRAIVYGHGVFTTGREGFGPAFRAMVEVENLCREEYFRRLESRLVAAP